MVNSAKSAIDHFLSEPECEQNILNLSQSIQKCPQLNLSDTDNEGAEKIVCIREMSIL